MAVVHAPGLLMHHGTVKKAITFYTASKFLRTFRFQPGAGVSSFLASFQGGVRGLRAKGYVAGDGAGGR